MAIMIFEEKDFQDRDGFPASARAAAFIANARIQNLIEVARACASITITDDCDHEDLIEGIIKVLRPLKQELVDLGAFTPETTQ